MCATSGSMPLRSLRFLALAAITVGTVAAFSPAPEDSYCGTTWADAATCKHAKCHHPDDCPKDAPNCYNQINCTAPGPPPKDCNTPGSTTNCTALNKDAYCGDSQDPAGRFDDGTGCSCDDGFKYDAKDKTCTAESSDSYCGATWNDAATCKHPKCHNQADCPKDAAHCYAKINCTAPGPPPTPPKDCHTSGSTTNCTALDKHAYCGESQAPAGRFDDGTGCSCDWGYNYSKTDKACE